MKHTNAVGVAVHIFSFGLQMMRWNVQSKPSDTHGVNQLYTPAREAIQHSCNFLTGVVGVNLPGMETEWEKHG